MKRENRPAGLHGVHDVDGGLHAVLIADSGELGVHSGRVKFFVACLSCRKVLHWSTTSPNTWIDDFHRENQPAPYETP